MANNNQRGSQSNTRDNKTGTGGQDRGDNANRGTRGRNDSIELDDDSRGNQLASQSPSDNRRGDQQGQFAGGNGYTAESAVTGGRDSSGTVADYEELDQTGGSGSRSRMTDASGDERQVRFSGNEADEGRGQSSMRGNEDLSGNSRGQGDRSDSRGNRGSSGARNGSESESNRNR